MSSKIYADNPSPDLIAVRKKMWSNPYTRLTLLLVIFPLRGIKKSGKVLFTADFVTDIRFFVAIPIMALLGPMYYQILLKNQLEYYIFILYALLISIPLLADSWDGIIARWYNESSIRGAYRDRIRDKQFMFFVAFPSIVFFEIFFLGLSYYLIILAWLFLIELKGLMLSLKHYRIETTPEIKKQYRIGNTMSKTPGKVKMVIECLLLYLIPLCTISGNRESADLAISIILVIAAGLSHISYSEHKQAIIPIAS